MSFSGDKTRPFLDPLKGGTTTFLLDSRSTNLGYARTLMRMLAQDGGSCAVFDLDAFYSSNADYIFGPLAATAASTTIKVPDPNSSMQDEVSKLFEVGQEVVVIDSMNTLYHLIAQEDGNSRSRTTAFTVEALSYLARSNRKAVLLTMYKRTGFPRRDTGRSISTLSDSTVTVEVRDKELRFRSDRGIAWPRGTFSIQIP
jgi:hypothetical protein